MLKLLTKTLLISVLSGSLMLIDFSHKGAVLQSAYAETVKGDKIDDSNMMATLTMTGVGLLASRLYQYKMTPDIMVAAAGGAAFIAGEIVAASDLKKVAKGLEAEFTRKEDGTVDQKQIEAIEKLKKSYEEAKNTANTKKMLQMAAAAAFAGAGVLAYTMTVNEEALRTACQAGLTAAAGPAKAGVKAQCTMHETQAAINKAKCSSKNPAACAKAKYHTAEAATCNSELAACSANIMAHQGMLNMNITTREVPAPTLGVLPATQSQSAAIVANFPQSASICGRYGAPMAAAEAGGNCPTMAAINAANESGGNSMMWSMFTYEDIHKMISPTNQYITYDEKADDRAFIVSFTKAAMNLFMSEAKASLFEPMGIASSLAIKYILTTSPVLATSLDMNLLIPKRRALAWGVMSALTAAASMSTDNVIKQIEGNITKIDAILNSLNSMAKNTAANAASASNIRIGTQIQKNLKLGAITDNVEDIDLLGRGGEGIPCLTKVVNGKCQTFDSSLLNSPSLANLSPDFLNRVNNITSLANGLNNTSRISASTLRNASNVAQGLGALRSTLSSAQSETQKILKKNGSNENLEQGSKAISDNLQKIIQAELDKNNVSASQMVASIQGSRGATGGASATDAVGDAELAKKLLAEAKAKEASEKNKKRSVYTGGNALGFGGLDANGLRISGLSPEEEAAMKEEKELEAQRELLKTTKAIAPMDDYELKNGDITKDKEASIFDVISNRYQKSGYQRLFRRVK